MTNQSKMPQSIFPDYPRDGKVSEENGMISEDFSLYLSTTTQALQDNFKNEGIVFPPLTITQINSIQAIYTPLIGGPLPIGTPDISGQSIFDSTNRVPKQFVITYDNATPPNIVTASWKTFTLT